MSGQNSLAAFDTVQPARRSASRLLSCLMGERTPALPSITPVSSKPQAVSRCTRPPRFHLHRYGGLQDWYVQSQRISGQSKVPVREPTIRSTAQQGPRTLRPRIPNHSVGGDGALDKATIPRNSKDRSHPQLVKMVTYVRNYIGDIPAADLPACSATLLSKKHWALFQK